MYQNKNHQLNADPPRAEKVITQAMVEGEHLTWLGRFIEKIVRRLISLIIF